MNKLKYFVCTAATLSMFIFAADADAQRRERREGGNRGGGSRPAPQFNPAPQMRAQPQARAPQVRAPQVRAPSVRVPAVTGRAGGDARVRTEGSANVRRDPRVADPNARIRTSGSADATGGVRVSDGSVRVRGEGSAAAEADVRARTDSGVRRATTDSGVRRASADMELRDRRLSSQAISRSNVNIGQRSINLAGSNFRPGYQYYPSWHRGYWNNYYGWNPMIGYGPGFGYGGYGIRLGNVGIGYGGYGGGYGGFGGYGYGRYPIGWGYGGWGLGSTFYNSGYLPYRNPYWFGGDVLVYDYARPIMVTSERPSDIVSRDFDSAREAFKAEDYDTALALVNRAIKERPNDSVLHEFRSLTLFAMKDYNGAAATIHSVLAVGPGWDWATMAALYRDVNVYTGQLRGLENYSKDHADEAAPQFLLGYHYMTTGHPEAAAKEFAQVVKLEPKDRVAADLLALVDKPKDSDVVESPPPAPAEETAPVSKPDENVRPIDAAAMAGTWQATRDDGSKFKLDLRKDKTFTWHFTQDSRDEEFSGTYSTEGSLLILQRQEGGAMVGHVAQDGDGRFTFKLLGAPADDPGLTFSR